MVVGLLPWVVLLERLASSATAGSVSAWRRFATCQAVARSMIVVLLAL